MSTLTSRSAAPWPKLRRKWTRLPKWHCQKVKTTQQAAKPDPAVAKKDESPGPTPPAADMTPSLFAAEQNAEPTTQAAEEEGETQSHDRNKSAFSQLYIQRRETSGSGSEDDAGRSENHLQPPISGTGHGRNHGARGFGGTSAVQLCSCNRDQGINRNARSGRNRTAIRTTADGLESTTAMSARGLLIGRRGGGVL
jgi:hypothetical protein